MSFSDPIHNIEQLGLTEGMRVADFGSGAGFYVMEAAKKVGLEGKVYAVDIQSSLLTRLKNQAREQGLTNVEVVHGDLETLGGSKLHDMFVDVVIVSDILFQVEHKNIFFDEVSRVLKQGGRVLVVEWSGKDSPLCPVPYDRLYDEAEAKKECERHALSFVKDIQAGVNHYGFIMKKI